MTTLNYNNFIKPLKTDLDENIIQHARISENAIIDIINPCTGTIDQIQITHGGYVSGDIVSVMYIIDTDGIDRSNPESLKVPISSLEELYEWVLIDEEV